MMNLVFHISEDGSEIGLVLTATKQNIKNNEHLVVTVINGYLRKFRKFVLQEIQ